MRVILSCGVGGWGEGTSRSVFGANDVVIRAGFGHGDVDRAMRSLRRCLRRVGSFGRRCLAARVSGLLSS